MPHIILDVNRTWYLEMIIKLYIVLGPKGEPKNSTFEVLLIINLPYMFLFLSFFSFSIF